MTTRRLAVALATAAVAAGVPAGGGAVAAEGATPVLRIELNRLEDQNGACRAYMVFENRGTAILDPLELDLVLFDHDGVIARRLAVQGGPLPAGKTLVRAFDLAGMACDRLGRVLLNEILSCGAGSAAQDCLGAAELAHRTGIPFTD